MTSGTSLNLNADQNIDENQDDESQEGEKYNDLKNKSKEKDDEIKKLERQYLETVSRLLIMVQLHCEIKTDMYQKFSENGALRNEKKEN